MYSKEHILFGEKSGTLYLFNRRTQQTYTFAPIAHHPSNIRRLTQINDRFNNEIRFIYRYSNLVQAAHSDGFVLDIVMRAGSIVRIDYVSPTHNQSLVKLTHNEAGQLIGCESFQFGALHHAYNRQDEMTEWWGGV